jgi:hypothetical protein
MEIDEEYREEMFRRVMSIPKEQLYEAVEVYLKNRISAGGKEIINLENEISCDSDFNIYHYEIIRREITGEKRPSEYMIFFQEMLMEAKIIKERMYPVASRN